MTTYYKATSNDYTFVARSSTRKYTHAYCTKGHFFFRDLCTGYYFHKGFAGSAVAADKAMQEKNKLAIASLEFPLSDGKPASLTRHAVSEFAEVVPAIEIDADEYHYLLTFQSLSGEEFFAQEKARLGQPVVG